MFYTYGHYTESGRLFYIGKGLKRRMCDRSNRNKHWQNTVAKHGLKVEVFSEWESEKDALSHEVFLISCFRDLGFKLCNQTNGGDGFSGGVVSEENRRLSSLRFKGRPAPNKGKPSPLKGLCLSEEHKQKLSAVKLGKPSHRKGAALSKATRSKISAVQIGSRWLNNGTASVHARADKIEQYLAEGYIFGRLSSKRSGL
jgi:hypothetical protein